MGITGLIPFLEKATETINIEKFRGKVVAVDSYCLLHKGGYSCSYELVQGQATNKLVIYCMKYVNMLLSLNIKPIMVFDGQSLPAKSETNAKRREQRKEAKVKAKELLRQGKSEEARKYLNAAIEITHEMAHQLMVECRKVNVDSITAPYESDSQLCYLNIKGIADAVISEDSDLVLFGCKTVLFKLQLTGACLMLDSEKIYLSMNCIKEKFSFDKFRMMCILSGCDYLNSLPGIGLGKALKFVNMTEQTDIKKALKKIPSYLKLSKVEVTDEYIDDFLKANATFKHMFVFDPIERKMVRLNELEDDSPDYQYCTNAGSLLDNKTAFQLALGNLNPRNLSQVMDDFNPDTFVAKKSNSMRVFCNHPSIWKKSQTETKKLPEKIPKQRKLSLRPKTSDVLPKMDPAVFEVYKNENEVEEFDENDIISKYSCSSSMQPSTKKQKTVHDFSTATHVNPFFRSSSLFEKKGKPQELKEVSLMKQTSPVVNKFKKTVVNENQRVVSRFFTSKSSSMEVNFTSQRESSEATEILETSSTEITQESQNSIDTSSLENKSETNCDSQRSDISESTNSKMESLALVDSKEPIDLELYEFNKALFKNSSNEKSTTAKKQSGGCKRPGLSRNAKPKNSAIQMKLSNFGFQKKPTI